MPWATTKQYRGTTTQQGWGAAHQRLRRQWQRHIDQHGANCWRCGADIPTRSHDWHLGHDDYDRTQYRGPECPPCNLRAAARKGALIANANRKRRRQLIERTQQRW